MYNGVYCDESLMKQIEEIQKDFEYTCLANTGDLEIWRCRNRNGSSNYAFDILISRYGISTHGDIRGLQFRVGSEYGMKFLAGNDLNYYIESKLESYSREYDLDESYLKEFVARQIVYMADKYPESFVSEDSEISECFSEPLDPEKIFEEIKRLSTEMCDSRINGISDAITRMRHVSSLDEAYHFIEDMSDNLDNPDLSDCSFRKISTSTLLPLYMVNHAARMIIKQQGESVGDSAVHQ